jgi:formiminotetrahydrofolate cyclodeaminase
MSLLDPDEPLTSVIASIGTGATGRGAGVAAALSAAMAAALVERVARASGAGGTVAQATALRRRLEALAVLNAEAYADAVDALRHRDELPARARDHSLGAALERAGLPPGRIAAAAADVAELAEQTVRDADPEHHPDLAGAVALAHASARAAAELVAVNLTMRAGDDRQAEVAAHVARAAAADPPRP